MTPWKPHLGATVRVTRHEDGRVVEIHGTVLHNHRGYFTSVRTADGVVLRVATETVRELRRRDGKAVPVQDAPRWIG